MYGDSSTFYVRPVVEPTQLPIAAFVPSFTRETPACSNSIFHLERKRKGFFAVLKNFIDNYKFLRNYH
jgi:hypothetical protein